MNNSQLEKGLNLFNDEKYLEAMKLLLPLAEQGDLKSQSKVGLVYMLGFNGRRDIGRAIFWLQKAASCGEGEAAHNLGTLYLTCEPDSPKCDEKSRYWYSEAKKLGFVVGVDS